MKVIRTEIPEVLILEDRKSTRLNSSHSQISYAVFCLKKKNHIILSLIRLSHWDLCWTYRSSFILAFNTTAASRCPPPSPSSVTPSRPVRHPPLKLSTSPLTPPSTPPTCCSQTYTLLHLTLSTHCVNKFRNDFYF